MTFVSTVLLVFLGIVYVFAHLLTSSAVADASTAVVASGFSVICQFGYRCFGSCYSGYIRMLLHKSLNLLLINN